MIVRPLPACERSYFPPVTFCDTLRMPLFANNAEPCTRPSRCITARARGARLDVEITAAMLSSRASGNRCISSFVIWNGSGSPRNGHRRPPTRRNGGPLAPSMTSTGGSLLEPIKFRGRDVARFTEHARQRDREHARLDRPAQPPFDDEHPPLGRGATSRASFPPCSSSWSSHAAGAGRRRVGRQAAATRTHPEQVVFVRTRAPRNAHRTALELRMELAVDGRERGGSAGACGQHRRALPVRPCAHDIQQARAAIGPNDDPRRSRSTDAGATAAGHTSAPELRFVLLVLIAPIAGVLVATAKYGIGLTPDSVVYFFGARSLAAGHGYINDGRPITDFPPGYSAVLSVAQHIGGTEFGAARLIAVLGFVATVILGYLLLRRHCTSPGVRLGATTVPRAPRCCSTSTRKR